jgi:predicted esterase
MRRIAVALLALAWALMAAASPVPDSQDCLSSTASPASPSEAAVQIAAGRPSGGQAILPVGTREKASDRGRLIENVATLADATQTYTLYLPTSYDPARLQPLLLVFDPRGRGSVAAEIFRPAAEEFGWILISSNGTASDDEGKANARAIPALMPEVKRYASDPRRIYAAGFSGTAIVATAIGVDTGMFAGVISVGGRLVQQVPPARFSFAHYGFAGDRDFNNREMRLIDAMLEREGKVHRFEQFNGEHRWITSGLASHALGWMELVAMKERRRPVDNALVATLHQRDVATAKALESAGRKVEALRLYRDIAATFDGLAPADDSRLDMLRLQADRDVQRELQEIVTADALESRYSREVFAHLPQIVAGLRVGKLTVERVEREFFIPELKRRAVKDTYDGFAARRLLEAVFGQTNFYLPQQLTDPGDAAVVAALRGVAARIHPDRVAPRPH